jgi:hypothetical protein
VEVTVAVGVRVNVGTPLTTVALAQSMTRLPSASCLAEHALFAHWPGSRIVVALDNVLDAPACKPSSNAHST